MITVREPSPNRSKPIGAALNRSLRSRSTKLTPLYWREIKAADCVFKPFSIGFSMLLYKATCHGNGTWFMSYYHLTYNITSSYPTRFSYNLPSRIILFQLTITKSVTTLLEKNIVNETYNMQNVSFLTQRYIQTQITQSYKASSKLDN